MIQQMFMHDLELNYQWRLLYQGNTKAEIRAVGSNWDMDRIHQDTLKMAERLQQHAKEQLKNESLKDEQKSLSNLLRINNINN